jgi:hypothetical protein
MDAEDAPLMDGEDFFDGLFGEGD